MKIAFLCRSLEPGKDGVGDYSRRLAGELIRRGNPCVAVALNDPYASNTVFEQQEIEGHSVSVMRLPAAMPKNRRAIAARQWLDSFAPDWASLQFVPYGFDSRGLCFGLGNWLAAINARASWHIMFHELWVGLGAESTVKERVWGTLQRHAVLQAARRLRPQMVHTNADPYRTALDREKIKANILPLFSNIPRLPGDGWHDVLGPLVAAVTGKPSARETLYLAGILGAVYSQWNARQAIETILPLARRFQKRLVLVFLGKNNLDAGFFDNLRRELDGQADVVVTGERPPADISKVLQSLDLGLAASPLAAIQKSGSAAAMLEHGLPLLVTRNDWYLRGAARQLTANNPRIFTPQQFAALDYMPVRDPAVPAENGVEQVAGQMLAALKSVAVAGA